MVNLKSFRIPGSGLSHNKCDHEETLFKLFVGWGVVLGDIFLIARVGPWLEALLTEI